MPLPELGHRTAQRRARPLHWAAGWKRGRMGQTLQGKASRWCMGECPEVPGARPREQEGLVFLTPRRQNLECQSVSWGSRTFWYSSMSYRGPALLFRLKHIRALESSVMPVSQELGRFCIKRPSPCIFSHPGLSWYKTKGAPGE